MKFLWVPLAYSVNLCCEHLPYSLKLVKISVNEDSVRASE